MIPTVENLITAAINRLLSLDPDSGHLLEGLSGKLIAVAVRDTELAVYLLPNAHGISFSFTPGPADVTVTGTPFELLALLRGVRGDGVTPRGVGIEGDAEVLHQLQDFAGRLDLDWEECLSRVMGDIAAHQLGNVLRSTWRWGERAREAVLTDLGEYLTEEVQMVLGPHEVDVFAANVDRLRDDVARLEQRIQRFSIGVGAGIGSGR